mmetsp:Transcript_33238/g.50130  ORF Transcript_33238/g.50130 Transcript_33238/m.50130 type:complete len:140 (+) Transcript_33238:188-607(+)
MRLLGQLSKTKSMIKNESDHCGKSKRRRSSTASEKSVLEERRVKIRLSAHQSRVLRKEELRYLQEQLAIVRKDKRELKESNDDLSSQLHKTLKHLWYHLNKKNIARRIISEIFFRTCSGTSREHATKKIYEDCGRTVTV